MNYKLDKIIRHKGEYVLVKNAYTGLFDLYERVLMDNERCRILEMIKEYENEKSKETKILYEQERGDEFAIAIEVNGKKFDGYLRIVEEVDKIWYT